VARCPQPWKNATIPRGLVPSAGSCHTICDSGMPSPLRRVSYVGWKGTPGNCSTLGKGSVSSRPRLSCPGCERCSQTYNERTANTANAQYCLVLGEALRSPNIIPAHVWCKWYSQRRGRDKLCNKRERPASRRVWQESRIGERPGSKLKWLCSTDKWPGSNGST
jgi:hypothetical protein